MKKRNGFTLIELLAVVVILALIALVILPTISGLTKQTRMKAFENTAYGLVKVGQQYFSENKIIDGKFKEQTFNFPKDADKLDFNGEVPKSGTMTINKNGEIEISITNDRYCATKSFTDSKVTVTEDVENCGVFRGKTLSQLATTSTELGVTSVHACATSGTCASGTAFAIKVNEEKIYKFYVIADDGKTITLIMNENLYEEGNTTEPDVAWVSKVDYNDDTNYGTSGNNNKGPITALNVLDARTLDWDYITAKDYTYSGIGHTGTTRKYEDITRTMKARMITYSEANTLGCITSSGGCPSWLYENLYSTGDTNTFGYWMSTASASSSVGAWAVQNNGILTSYNVIAYFTNGIRPVIELSK